MRGRRCATVIAPTVGNLRPVSPAGTQRKSGASFFLVPASPQQLKLLRGVGGRFSGATLASRSEVGVSETLGDRAPCLPGNAREDSARSVGPRRLGWRAAFAGGDGSKFGRNLGAKSAPSTRQKRPFRRAEASKGSTFNGTYRCGLSGR